MNIWYNFTTLGVTSPGGQWDEGHGVLFYSIYSPKKNGHKCGGF